MTQYKIRIGGVPEHFNLPWHLAIETGQFEKEGIAVEWKTFKGGTGEMNANLREDQCDLCVVLTEGIITDILKGNPSKIISGYVKTPLIWGIHVGIEDVHTTSKNIYDQKIAVSRPGSGSHLMPIVDALEKEKTIQDHQFVHVQDIDGAISSLNSGDSQVFYWEKYTTKPYVEKKQLKRVGEFVSPWPCFVIAATEKIIEKEPVLIDKVLRIIHAQCNDFMNSQEAIDLVSTRFNIQRSDAAHWFHATEWATNSWVSDKMLTSVLFTLKEAGIASQEAQTTNLVWKRKK